MHPYDVSIQLMKHYLWIKSVMLFVVENTLNPHTNMWGPRGPRKTLKAAQTLVIGISELMFWVFPEIEQAQTDSGCAQLSHHTSKLLGSVRTPHIKKCDFFSIFVWGLIIGDIGSPSFPNLLAKLMEQHCMGKTQQSHQQRKSIPCSGFCEHSLLFSCTCDRDMQ